MVGFRLCLFAFAVIFVFLQTGHSGSMRTRRSIDQFGNIIRLTTVEAWLFNNYGNHCGGGGSDSTNRPLVDSIDRCCRQHDLCYESLAKGPCFSSFLEPYFSFYTWKPVVSDAAIECGDSDNDCKLATCNCDRAAAQCLARHSVDYNPANKRSSIWDWLA